MARLLVKDLINILSNCNPDSEVWVPDVISAGYNHKENFHVPATSVDRDLEEKLGVIYIESNETI